MKNFRDAEFVGFARLMLGMTTAALGAEAAA